MELLLPAYARATEMPDLSCISNYTIAHGNARSLTHLARPGIEPATSWFLVGFISPAPRQELQSWIFFPQFFNSINFIIFIVVQPLSHPNFTTFSSQTPHPFHPPLTYFFKTIGNENWKISLLRFLGE